MELLLNRERRQSGLPTAFDLGEQLRLVAALGSRKGKIKPLKYPALFKIRPMWW